MQQEYINFIITPVMAGVVGYVTNWLAIKMLFRPYKAKWYTLGWQGIIPRTREELAENVAEMICSRLITAGELDKSLSKPEFREKIYEMLTTSFNGGTSNLREFLVNSGALGMIAKLMSDRDFTIKLDSAAEKIFTKILDGYLENTTVEEIASVLEKSGTATRAEELGRKALEVIIKNSIGGLSNSDKTIGDFLDLNTSALSGYVLKIVNPVVEDIFNNPDVAEECGEFLVKYKAQIRSTTNRMISSIINTILHDDKIRTQIRQLFPAVGSLITGNGRIQHELLNSIENKIKIFLSTPFRELVADINPEGAALAAGPVVENICTQIIASKLADIIQNRKEETLAAVFREYGLDASCFIPRGICLSGIIGKSLFSGVIKSGEAEYISISPTGELLYKASGWVVDLLRWVAPKFLSMADFKKLVLDKINSLELAEVEDMLFSFMSRHFKWINILGFIIGFIVGLVQVVTLYFTG